MKKKLIRSLLIFIFTISIALNPIRNTCDGAVTDPPETTNISINSPIGSSSTIENALSGFFLKIQDLFAVAAIVVIAIAGIIYLSAGVNSQLAETAKKTLTGAIIGLMLFLGIPTFLKEINNILNNTAGEAPTFTEIAQNLLNTILSLAGIIAIISTAISGIMYLSAMGNPQQSESAKKAFQFSILGVIVTLSGLIIVKQITVFFQ